MCVQRLLIAKEYGDKSAERRAYSNLGNAHIFLGNFTAAAEFYQSVNLLCISCNVLWQNYSVIDSLGYYKGALRSQFVL